MGGEGGGLGVRRCGGEGGIPYHTIPYHAIPYHTISIPYHTWYLNPMEMRSKSLSMLVLLRRMMEAWASFSPPFFGIPSLSSYVIAHGR